MSLGGGFPFGLGHQGGERQECHDVGEDHQLVEHILEFPGQVVLDNGAQEDETRGQDVVDGEGFFAEEVVEVDFSEEIPAQDGGEGEEEEADGHEGQAGTGRTSGDGGITVSP